LSYIEQKMSNEEQKGINHMNQLERYRCLLNKKGQIVQLIEIYQNSGIDMLMDYYIQDKHEIDKELSDLRKELKVVNN